MNTYQVSSARWPCAMDFKMYRFRNFLKTLLRSWAGSDWTKIKSATAYGWYSVVLVVYALKEICLILWLRWAAFFMEHSWTIVSSRSPAGLAKGVLHTYAASLPTIDILDDADFVQPFQHLTQATFRTLRHNVSHVHCSRGLQSSDFDARWTW